MRFILFLLIGFTFCGLKNADNSIVFVVLSIHKSPADSKSVIELVSKTKSTGTFKKQIQNASSQNYLSIYVYGDKKITDTLRIEHPLYKHLEYVNTDNTLSAKDTVLDKADFFIRLQLEGQSNEIKIFETLQGKSLREELITIKL